MYTVSKPYRDAQCSLLEGITYSVHIATTEVQVILQLCRCCVMAWICRSLKKPTLARCLHEYFPLAERRVHRPKSLRNVSHADVHVSITLFACSAMLTPSDCHSDSSMALKDSSADAAESRSVCKLRTVSGASTIFLTSSMSWRAPCKARPTTDTIPVPMLSGSAILNF